MSNQESLIKNMHKISREDLWLQEIFKSGGISLDEIQTAINILESCYWFDTIPLECLPLYEKLLIITPDVNATVENRRSFIEAKWKSNGKCDLLLIQAVCNSWKNGGVSVKFIGGKIQLKFNGAYGIPADLPSLLAVIENIKPAHLPYSYIFAYLLVRDMRKMTVGELRTKKLNMFAFNKK
ncbi:YmfQ family protein [Clostridium estertheticum]|uniref:putative phage tail protein n=1 Tax=Clostridium estertheticum TaxID=238834 RepID=UPI001C6EC913|nr:putative phage tail protein [Clostridium estertheticum]MBW9170787.1 YmfQ family protein [Clostridium estertheticum]WLC74374.1 YmfQ family protein [Clostridium estertheticum]